MHNLSEIPDSSLAPCRSSGEVGLCCSSETAGHSTNGPTAATFRFDALHSPCCWQAIGFFFSLPSLRRFHLPLLVPFLYIRCYCVEHTLQRCASSRGSHAHHAPRAIGRSYRLRRIFQRGENAGDKRAHFPLFSSQSGYLGSCGNSLFVSADVSDSILFALILQPVSPRAYTIFIHPLSPLARTRTREIEKIQRRIESTSSAFCAKRARHRARKR